MALITIIVGRAAQFLIALITLRVATTLLSPEEMGKVALVVTTTAFFALLLINPVGMFINRRLHAWQASGRGVGYLVRYAGYIALVAAIAAVGLPLFVRTGLISFGIPTVWLIALVCGSVIFNTVNQTAIPCLNLLGDSRRFILLTVATLIASFLAAVTLVLTVQRTAEYWMLGILLGQALLALIGTRDLFAQLSRSNTASIQQPIHRQHLRSLFAFSWPVAIAAGLGWVQAQGYRYLMVEDLGLAQVGLFVAGYGLSAGIIAGFESVLTTYFQPRLYRDASATDPQLQTKAWRRYASAVIPSLVLTVGLLVVLAPDLTRLLLGEKFQAAASFVIWGALAEAARVLASVYSLIAHVHMRTRWLIWPNVVGAVISIVACSLLMPVFGAHGAGMGLAAAGALTIVTMHLVLLRKIGGGISARPILVSFALTPAFLAIAMVLRHWLPTASWVTPIATCAVIGLAFLFMQYLLLHKHLEDRP
ncbi:MAG: oligosaccharide flippase family protein [Hydrogenophaga sp.]|uniref:lipopolysaccharide biosynthesis protein n=1 Tax=Hydrogenophaga sp. TaxID=1904254 RepID=UPI0027374365|nr:oligosaccharide flippase family protein [Hydrogenophaga sp.]MDP3349062.1 oligosaccharide flippase family protein [Hydrogenophaga sp.]